MQLIILYQEVHISAISHLVEKSYCVIPSLMLFFSKEIILRFIHHVSLCIKLSQGLVKVINTHQSMFRLVFGSKDIK